MQVKYTRYVVETEDGRYNRTRSAPFRSKKKAREHADVLALDAGMYAHILFIEYGENRTEVNRGYCLDGFRYRKGGVADV